MFVHFTHTTDAEMDAAVFDNKDGETLRAQMSIIEFRVAREFDVVKIKREPTVDEVVAKKKQDKICLLCDKPHGDAEIVRGVHRNCYSSLIRLCRKGTEDEADLIRDGILLPADEGGRDSIAEQLLKQRRARA